MFKINFLLALFLTIFVSLLAMIIPMISQSAGLVPCGGPEEPACQFCHLFVLFDNIIKFLLFNVVPPIAVIMLVIAGITFYTAMGDPQKVNLGINIFKWVLIGLVIIYGAWLLVDLFFMMIGVADWKGFKGGWYTINCPTK